MQQPKFTYGWDSWIRTNEMADSESAALPLGYIPMTYPL